MGNFTSPINLTHGERTGACMRIGSNADSLYHFCLEDENGFHITFKDPKTGKYISRVSGFRNGNTVFLNELRCSLKPNKYSDADLEAFCQKTAEMLITKSKESGYPIDNVWVSIVNIGKYPVRHLEVYGEYYFPFIKPGECIQIILTLDTYPRRTNAYSSIELCDR